MSHPLWDVREKKLVGSRNASILPRLSFLSSTLIHPSMVALMLSKG